MWNPSKPGSDPSSEVLEIAQNSNVGSVLDAGCGWGRNLMPFVGRVDIIHGFDSDEASVVEAKDLLGDDAINPKIWVADIRDVAIDRQYDLVLCYGVLHFLAAADRRRVYPRIRDWVAPGGLAVVVLFNQVVPIPDDLQPLMSEAPVDSFELLEQFSDWQTVALRSYVYDDEHDDGKIRHRHSIDRLVVRAPR